MIPWTRSCLVPVFTGKGGQGAGRRRPRFTQTPLREITRVMAIRPTHARPRGGALGGRPEQAAVCASDHSPSRQPQSSTDSYHSNPMRNPAVSPQKSRCRRGPAPCRRSDRPAFVPQIGRSGVTRRPIHVKVADRAHKHQPSVRRHHRAPPPAMIGRSKAVAAEGRTGRGCRRPGVDQPITRLAVKGTGD